MRLSEILRTTATLFFACMLPAFSVNDGGCMKELEQARQAAHDGHCHECYAHVSHVAPHGPAKAQNLLGQMYEEGLGVEKNIVEAIKWYERAAMRGIPEAENRLGHIYYRGGAVGQDLQKARKWLARAAKHDVGEAQYTLGHMYQNGEGVPVNRQTAAGWLKKAAVHGFVGAEEIAAKVPPLKPITQEGAIGRSFESGMGNIEQSWEGYGDIVEQLRAISTTNH
jgi:hypothetical protein